MLDYIAPDLRPLAVEVSTLALSPRNARRHEDADLRVLMQSLSTFRQRKPVIARRDTREVIAGNGTLLAAQRLGWSHVAVAWFDGTDEEATAYAIADNRTAELSRWDFEVLSAQLSDLADLDPGLPAALGWCEADAAALLSAEWTPPEPIDLPTDVAEPPATVIFSAAQHRVIQRAVGRVRDRERKPRLTAGRCLELVCADWLSGPYPDGG